MEENNTCISQELVENHYYYLDSDSKKYISCSIIENCVTCSSKRYVLLVKVDLKSKIISVKKIMMIMAYQQELLLELFLDVWDFY